jgi:uncharacterized protein YlxW (UPF0749 family)
MKKIFLLAFVATMSTAVFAQATPTKKDERKDLKMDAKDLKQDRKDLKTDIKNGDKNAAALERKDIQADKKDMRGDAKTMGIKHPARVVKHHRHH